MTSTAWAVHSDVAVTYNPRSYGSAISGCIRYGLSAGVTPAQRLTAHEEIAIAMAYSLHSVTGRMMQLAVIVKCRAVSDPIGMLGGTYIPAHAFIKDIHSAVFETHRTLQASTTTSRCQELYKYVEIVPFM